MKPEIKSFQSVKECPKCRALASEAGYKYVDDGVWQNTLLRTCARCGFSWPEHPADHAELQPKDPPEEEWWESIPPNAPWFIYRMMGDTWSFGLLDASGTLYGISHIIDIKEIGGQVWLDLELACWGIEKSHAKALGAKHLIDGNVAPDAQTCQERGTISINASHIVAAFDMALLTGS